MDEQGLNDAAIMLMSLGEEEAAEVFKHFSPKEVQKLGEAIAQDIAARVGIEIDADTKQADLLFKLGREINLDSTVRSLFHTLRIEGNKATFAEALWPSAA